MITIAKSEAREKYNQKTIRKYHWAAIKWNDCSVKGSDQTGLYRQRISSWGGQSSGMIKEKT